MVNSAAYLVFQLWTHAHLYSETSASSSEPLDGHATFRGHRILRQAKSVRSQNPQIRRAPAFDEAVVDGRDATETHAEDEDEEDEEVPTLNLVSAIVLLAASTALVGVTSEWLVDSINGITDTGAISKVSSLVHRASALLVLGLC